MTSTQKIPIQKAPIQKVPPEMTMSDRYSYPAVVAWVERYSYALGRATQEITARLGGEPWCAAEVARVRAGSDDVVCAAGVELVRMSYDKTMRQFCDAVRCAGLGAAAAELNALL